MEITISEEEKLILTNYKELANINKVILPNLYKVKKKLSKHLRDLDECLRYNVPNFPTNVDFPTLKEIQYFIIKIRETENRKRELQQFFKS